MKAGTSPEREMEEAETLRHVMLEFLSARTGKMSCEIFDDVVREFGPCDIRRMHRNLAYLVKVGCASKTERDGQHPLTTQRVPTYRATGEPLPPARGILCKVCVALGKRVTRGLCMADGRYSRSALFVAGATSPVDAEPAGRGVEEVRVGGGSARPGRGGSRVRQRAA